MLKLPIGSLLHQPEGTKEEFELNESIKFDIIDGFTTDSPITGTGQLLKLPHEINVQISDLKTTVPAICNRCLKHFVYEINVPLISGEFIIDLNKRDISKDEDVFYVDKNKNELDLTEFVRSELILHFPAVQVCFLGCKGLCDKCGVNLNDKTCNCKHLTEVKVTPFKFPNSRP